MGHMTKYTSSITFKWTHQLKWIWFIIILLNSINKTDWWECYTKICRFHRAKITEVNVSTRLLNITDTYRISWPKMIYTLEDIKTVSADNFRRLRDLSMDLCQHLIDCAENTEHWTRTKSWRHHSGVPQLTRNLKLPCSVFWPLIRDGHFNT